jgi:drug/metabolite transporter (DMT)-like permease
MRRNLQGADNGHSFSLCHQTPAKTCPTTFPLFVRPTSFSHSFSRKDFVLLAALTFCWGINWPIMKLGVADFPPITFRALCLLGGLPTLWIVARMQRVPLTIPSGKTGEIVRLAIPNMIMFHLFVILGVSMLASGRAAILCYTMPVWAVLAGLVFFNQRVGKAAWLGVGFAMAGALLLLSGELAAMAGKPLGSILTVIAAAAWGYGTVRLRHSDLLGMPTVALTFWMMAVGTLALGVVAFALEREQWRLPDAVETAALLYNAVIAIGIGQGIWFMLARRLPPVASGLSVMMIPVIGVFSGMALLGEQPRWQDFAAMLLILAAMSTILLKPRPPAS